MVCDQTNKFVLCDVSLWLDAKVDLMGDAA